MDDKIRRKLAPATVSEVHLDAQADYPPLSVEDERDFRRRNSGSDASEDFPSSQSAQALLVPILAELQALLSWFKGAPHDHLSGSYQSLESAETRLRAMLERQNRDLAVAIRTT